MKLENAKRAIEIVQIIRNLQDYLESLSRGSAQNYVVVEKNSTRSPVIIINNNDNAFLQGEVDTFCERLVVSINREIFKLTEELDKL